MSWFKNDFCTIKISIYVYDTIQALKNLPLAQDTGAK